MLNHSSLEGATMGPILQEQITLMVKTVVLFGTSRVGIT